MQKKKIKNEKELALFEIFILIVGIISFVYFIGNEFGFVSAADISGGECSTSFSYGPYTYTAESSTKITRTDGRWYSKEGDKWKYHDAVIGEGFVTEETEGSADAYNRFLSLSVDATACAAGIGARGEGKGGGLLDAAGTISSLVKPSGIAAEAAGGVGQSTGAAAAESTLPAGAAAGTQAAKTAGTASLQWNKFALNLQNGWFTLIVNAAIAYGLYQGVSKGLSVLFPNVNPQVWESLGKAVGIGYGVGAGIGVVLSQLGILPGLPILGIAGAGWGLIAAGVAAIIWFLTYNEENITAVIYSCYPWQPVTGGSDCHKCNTGEFPCTKYKCQSLGQSCELLNAGTKDEVCEWVNRNDVSPPAIEAWEGALTEGYEYVPDSARLPPDKGVIIKNLQSADGCVPPFTRIDYGINLDKPGKCKVDTVRTDDFKSMKFFISNSYYKYNHTITSLHAGTSELEGEGITLQNGGNYETFVRCESKNGVSNAGNFVFKYCVSDEPDITAPTIKLTNPINGMPIQQGLTSQSIEVYVDKPSDCKWSNNDEDYDIMPNTMTCAQSITEINANLLYKCTTTLTGLKDLAENKFYFRCKSYPLNQEADRYKNEESYVYSLIGTKALVIDSVKPVSGTTIKDSTQSVKVTLEAKTSAGYKDGEAKCYFKKASEPDSSYILFFNTNSYESTQDLWLPRGGYRYAIKCCDLGGNCDAQTTEFIVDTDFESPRVVRAYNEGTSLKIVTNEKAECVYDTTSCSYNFEDGIGMTSSDNLNHLTDWNTNNNFYIKCQDDFGNQPTPDACSIIVRPSDY